MTPLIFYLARSPVRYYYVTESNGKLIQSGHVGSLTLSVSIAVSIANYSFSAGSMYISALMWSAKHTLASKTLQEAQYTNQEYHFAGSSSTFHPLSRRTTQK